MNITNVNFALMHEDAKQPQRTHQNDAGNDLFSIEDVEIKPGQIVKIRTGVAVALPPGTQGLIKDRSSMGSKGLHVFAGVVDSGFTGELSVVLYNSNNWITPETVATVLKPVFSFKNLFNQMQVIKDVMKKVNEEYNSKSYFVKKGDKIAQLVVCPVSAVTWWKVKELTPTDRGSNGFGSSGR